MRRILIIGDVHGEHRRLEASLARVAYRRFDLALLVGDIGVDPPWLEPDRSGQRGSHDHSVRQVLEQVKRAAGGSVLFVPGNHDLPDPPALEVAENVDRRIVDVAGVSVAGFGGAGPTRFGFPYEWTEKAADGVLAQLFSDAPAPVDIFLCHTPPAGTKLELTASGKAVGSTAVDRWLERARPRLFVCGHIHESWGVDLRHGVPCLNAGALGEPFSQRIAWTVEWADGPSEIRCFRATASGPEDHRVWPV